MSKRDSARAIRKRVNDIAESIVVSLQAMADSQLEDSWNFLAGCTTTNCYYVTYNLRAGLMVLIEHEQQDRKLKAEQVANV